MRKHICRVSRRPEAVPKLAEKFVSDWSKTITFEYFERLLGVEIPDYEKYIHG